MRVFAVKLNAGSQVYKGSLVALDTDGFGRPATDTASYLVAGVALEDALGGASDGDVSVLVGCGCEFLFDASSITQAMMNTSPAMYVVDDNTIDDAAGATNDVFAGILTEYIGTTSGWVFVAGLTSPAAVLSGITASAAEINILDGATLDVNELNILDGQTITAAEANMLDGSAALGAVIYRQQTTLSAAQLKALRAANIEVVAAPGAGLAAVPVGAQLFLDHGGTDFVQVNNSDHLALLYNGGSEISELGAEAQCTTLLEASADAHLWADIGASFVPVANTAIDLDNNGAAEYTTGDGSLKITVYYRIVPMA